MAAVLKNTIMASFKMHGLTLRSEACRYLVEVLTPVSHKERDQWLDKIIEAVQKQPLTTAMVGKTECEAAVQECNSEQEDDSGSIFNIIDAFSVPRLSYVKERKKFIPDANLDKPAPSLHGTPSDKATMFRDRYMILRQRTLRHDLFTPPALGTIDADSNKFQLKQVEYLVGSTARLGNVLVLGMLVQLKEECGVIRLHLVGLTIFRVQLLCNVALISFRPCRHMAEFSTAVLSDLLILYVAATLDMWVFEVGQMGKWFLEDPTGCVQLDFFDANFQPGLFTENSFVLAEGWYEDGIFHIEAFGLPPPEKAETTRAYFGNINFFGGPSTVQVKASARLAQILTENTDAMFVLLSDVWLDNSRVMEKLNTLFKGYSDYPPTAFILCGNYLSSPKVMSHAKTLKDCFRNLGALLSNYPKIISTSQIIFVPGPNDPGHSTILPRPTIPNSITEAFRKKVPGAVFTSNPCRIQYCTQEIVVFREDIVTKMCRNCVKFPADGNVPTHFAKSLISQAHLCPLPLHVSPIYWAYDNGLRLYPLPDVIITADKFDPFTTTAVSATVVNPGSFLRTDFGFKVYYPATREVQDSQVIDDVDRSLISSLSDITMSQTHENSSVSLLMS